MSKIEDAKYVITLKPSDLPEGMRQKAQKIMNYSFANEVVGKSKFATKMVIAGGVLGFVYSIVTGKSKVASIVVGAMVMGITGYGLGEAYYKYQNKTEDDK